MKLHTKLVLSLIAVVIVVVVMAQFVQHLNITRLMSNFSSSNIELLKNREKDFAVNTYLTISRAVAGSLERGEMEKFSKLLANQRDVEGLLAFSLYDGNGVITHSSEPSLLNKENNKLPVDLKNQLLKRPEMKLIWKEDSIEIYKPQLIKADCIRCHANWKLGEMGGFISFIFSTHALAEAKIQNAALISDIKTSAFIVSFFAAFGIVLILTLTMNLLVKKLVSRPLNNTVEMLRDIAEGEGDLTRRLEVNSNDEVGELARWFNAFTEKLQNIIKKVSGDINELNESSSHFSSISDDMASKAYNMKDQTSTASDAVEHTTTNIKNMAAAAEEVSAQIATVASSSEEASVNMKQVGTAISDVSDSVNSVATSIEEMYASLNEVAKNSGRGANVTSDASQQATDTSEIVNKLGDAAKEIGDVVDLIKGIAAQTNLLALNATIEAAGAGDAGKGFAVVANEVKELARQTAGATEDIRVKVEGMQANTDSAVQAIQSIVEVINEINSIMSSMAAAVEEQTATTNEISKSIGETASSANSVSQNVQEAVALETELSRNMEEMAKAAVAIAKDAAEASSGTDTVIKNVTGVNDAAETTTKGAAQIKTKSEDLANLAKQLQTIMGQFKI